MPHLIPSVEFLDDLEQLRNEKSVRRNVASKLCLLGKNPLDPGLNIERIINDSSAWAVRLDIRHRISFEPTKYLLSGSPDWSAPIRLLRMIRNKDLYSARPIAK